ncbi:flagellar hook-basal body complex protein FliE [Bradyrhizobium sp. i1.8.4]|uniref:hypothetical protein n=1 Tax=unclassified Bradyrhizobium TaxID=2631580 RepID=UPI003D20398D
MNLPFARGSQVAKCETTLAADVKALETFEQELVMASADLETPDVDLTDDDLKAMISKRDLAKARVDQGRNRVRKSEQALNDARAAAAEKELKEALARVNALCANAHKVLEAFVVSSNREARKVLRTVAEADLAREELNRKLPEDQRIASFEAAVLMSPTIPRQDISRTRELHWINPHGGRPYAPEFARKIRDNGNGTASLSSAGGEYSSAHTVNITRRQYFDRVRYSDWVHGTGASSLAEVLALPGFRGGVPGWEPMSRPSPESILQELNRLESAEAPADREPEVKELLEPISPAFSTVEDLQAWEAQQAAQPKADEAA